MDFDLKNRICLVEEQASLVDGGSVAT